MASYGVLYVFRFESANKTNIEIQVLKKDYRGARMYRSLGRAPILKREKSGCVHGSSLELYAECQVDGEFASLYTSSADEYKVEVYKIDEFLGDTIMRRVWTGFVSPELYSEPDIAPPYDVQIIATDGLGELKNYAFEARGLHSVQDHLQYMLGHTGLAQDLDVISFMAGNSGTVPIMDVVVSLDHMAGESCYDVLKAVLDSFHAEIACQDGYWMIWRETDLVNLASQVEVAEFGSKSKADWWPVGQLSTVIEPAKKRVTVTSENAYKDNGLKEVPFHADGATYDSEEKAFVLSTAGASVFKTISFGAEVGYKLSLSVIARSVGSGDVGQSIGIKVKIEGRGYSAGDTFWLREKTDGKTAWSNAEGVIEKTLDAPSASDSAADAQTFVLELPLYYYSSRAYQYAEAIEVTVINMDGSYPVNVYDVTLSKAEQIKGYRSVVEIDNGAREEADEATLIIADDDRIPAAADLFMDGIAMNAAGALISSWASGRLLAMGYLAFMSRDYAMSFALPRMKVQGVLNVPESALITPVLFLRDNTYYFPETYNYDLLNDELSVSLVSIPTAEIDVVSEEVTEVVDPFPSRPSSGSSSGGSSSGGGASGGGSADIQGSEFIEVKAGKVNLVVDPQGGLGATEQGLGIIDIPSNLLEGIEIEVDSTMSDTSENAVANKVIKKYVDQRAEQAYEQSNDYTDEEVAALRRQIKESPESYVPLKTINGQSIYGAGDIIISGGGGTVTETKYNLRFSAYSNQTMYVSRGEKAEVKFSFISQVMYIGTSAFVDTGEAGIITVSVKRPSDSAYKVVKTMTVPSNAVQTVNVAEFLGDGNNLIRIAGEGETTGKTAENLAFTVVRSSLSIQSNFQWWIPQTAGSITLPYYVGGTIDKVLHVTIKGGSYSNSYSKQLGTQPYLESVASLVVSHPGTSGVYTISAYVASADGNFRTGNYDMQAIFVKEGATGQYMAVNNIAQQVTNYSENAFFDYALYNGGQTTAEATFQIRKDGASVYSAALGSIATGTRQTFSAPLEISTSDSSNFNVTVSATGGGVTLLSALSFEVDNSYSFAAFPGASFFMNPKTRDNSQSDRLYIVNEVDGQKYLASWDGMNWGSDGYQTVNGVKVLRIFAGSSVTIPVKPFEKEAARTGKTLELDILVDNVVDYDTTVVGIVKELTASWLGVKIFPDKAVVFSSLQGIEEDQSLKFEDKVRLRLTVVIMPEAYGNPGFNLVVVYVNGTKNREFAYTNTDSFQNNSGIRIGSESADIDTYALRIYDEALSSTAVHQNHINLLESIAEKKAFRDSNDVYAANGIDIDIEKVKKLCNVIEFEGEIPSKANPNKFTNNWYIYWRDNPEWNVVIKDITQDGQGTSAKEYMEWNQRGKVNDKTVATYADGSTTTGAFSFIPGLPKIKTLTWKLNWASSCQCNKMGSVNSINDLCEALAILDADRNPTAVYQRPFVGVRLSYDDSGQPVRTFLGLFTGGPDKGDPNWMNYDYDRYPNLISVEGADNASLGALFKVPWNPAAGRWQYNPDEESMQYNGVNAFDYNAGAAESKADIQALYERVWKPVYDFVYECSPNLAPWSGTLSELNAQASVLKNNDVEYWLPSGDLYYYEASEGKYIPSDSGRGTINLFDQLVDQGYGLTSAMVSGLSGEALNTYFKVTRVTRFRLHAADYFNVPQGRFAVNWNLALGSTDTRTKNTYWTVRGLLSDGYRCTLYWDDTDTIGPFTNQGQDRKPYWCEVGDKYDNGQPVWNGEQNRFYNLMELAFPDEIADDMRKMLDKMVELGGMTTGNKSEQLFAFFHKYYFSQAQEYFPSALYNATAKKLYESAKLIYGSGYTNDTDPITQSLGDYYSGWKRWIKRRIQYIQSKYRWGDYSGASGDSIIVRAAGQSISYQITPAIWMYPVVMNGTSPIRGARTEAGKVCNMTIELGGATDQQNAIKGVHYIQDIGAWHDKQVHGAMSVTGQMLRELHIGHPSAPIVITITSLTVKNTPSLRLIDLRRVGTLTGALNLADCTHLQTFYGQGTSLTSVEFGQGGPLAYIGYPSTMRQVLLRNFPRLYNSGVNIEECKAGVTDFLVSECPNLRPLELLAKILEAQEGQGSDHALIGVRVTGINETYNTSEMLGYLAGLTDGTYQGLNADGSRNEGNAILEGKVSINANAYQDEVEALENYFAGRLAITITGQFFLRIIDPEVIRVLNANGVGADGGVTKEQAEAVTTISTWFKGNTAIQSFDELQYFTAITPYLKTPTTWNDGAFYNCTSLERVTLPPNVTILSSDFRSCTKLREVRGLEQITDITSEAFTDCSSFAMELNLESLETISNASFRSTGITAILSLGKVKDIPGSSTWNYTPFANCLSLGTVVLPSTLESIGPNVFNNCKNLKWIKVLATTPPTLGNTNAFMSTNNCPIYVPDASVDAYKGASGWSNASIAARIKPLSEYNG